MLETLLKALRRSPSEGLFNGKMDHFGPLWVPTRPQSGSIYFIMVYHPPIKGFKTVWTFSVYDLGHFAISASGCMVFSNSEVVTLDVCCG